MMPQSPFVRPRSRLRRGPAVVAAVGVAVLLGGVGYGVASMVDGGHGTATPPAPPAAPAAIPSVESLLTGDITQCTGKINGVTEP